MPNNFKYRSGLHSVGAYQLSGVPYATGSLLVPQISQAPREISFPRITKFITIRNVVPTGSATANRTFRVGFSVHGTSGSRGSDNLNYFTLANGESYTGEWRLSKLYLLCHDADNPVLSGQGNESSASIIAGLTLIPTEELTGVYSDWTGSIGVG